MPPVAASTIGMTAAPGPVLSPMQYANPPGSSLPKTDMRNTGVDRRKRKYVIQFRITLFPIVESYHKCCFAFKIKRGKEKYPASILTRIFVYCCRKDG